MLTTEPLLTPTVLRARLSARAADAHPTLAARALDFVTAAAAATERAQPLETTLVVTAILLGLEADDETLAAALIATALPKKEIDGVLIKEAFGDDVAALVAGCGRAGRIEGAALGGGKDAPSIETMRKMLLAMADDVRVVLIKLAERVALLRGLTRAEEATQRDAAVQTRDLFAPLANRLGVFEIKWELEDFAFRYLDPLLYKKIAGLLDGKREEREAFIARVLGTLQGELTRSRIAAELAGRPKHIWSIHRKMQSKNLPFEALYDIRATRVLVDSVEDCYAVLALIHNLWQPIAGEFDDYIAQPKANNYQSLHTAVIGPEGKTLEVQIRTHVMHAASEHGVAAHWRYKEGGGAHKSTAEKKFESKIAWLRQVLEWNREVVDRSGFSEKVKAGLFNETVYVFTPQGKVIDLPRGATPVDFAYHVHTDLGHRCRGAKLDGHIVPLNTQLQNAQRVEILAGKVGGPSRDWLNPQLGFLMSHRAQSKVRNWFRQEYFEVDVAHGRQTMERELARAGASAIALEKVALALGHKELDECLAEIGRGDITAHQVEVALRELTANRPEAAPVLGFQAHSKAPTSGKASSGVLVLGVNNIATLVAKCCKPLPPDAIVGFVTKARGVMVHRQDCANIRDLLDTQRERLMPAEWGNTGDAAFSTDLNVTATDRQGLLRDLSEALAHERINVTAVNTLSRGNLTALRFTVELRRAEDLARVVRALSEVVGVEAVGRG